MHITYHDIYIMQRKGEGNDATMLWAKPLAQQIHEIRNDKKRKLLKINITHLVTECQLEDIEDDHFNCCRVHLVGGWFTQCVPDTNS